MSVAEGLAMSRCQKPAQIDILTSDVKEGEWGEWRGKFLKRTWTQNFNPELVDLAFCFLCFCLIKGTEPLPEIGIDYNQNGDRCDHCCADRGIPKEEQQTNQKLFLKGFNFPSLILWSIHSIILVARWGRIPSGHKPFFRRIWLSDFFFFFTSLFLQFENSPWEDVLCCAFQRWAIRGCFEPQLWKTRRVETGIELRSKRT